MHKGHVIWLMGLTILLVTALGCSDGAGRVGTGYTATGTRRGSHLSCWNCPARDSRSRSRRLSPTGRESYWGGIILCSRGKSAAIMPGAALKFRGRSG